MILIGLQVRTLKEPKSSTEKLYRKVLKFDKLVMKFLSVPIIRRDNSLPSEYFVVKI